MTGLTSISFPPSADFQGLEQTSRRLCKAGPLPMLPGWLAFGIRITRMVLVPVCYVGIWVSPLSVFGLFTKDDVCVFLIFYFIPIS